MICRICDSADLAPVLDLGMHPRANHYLKPAEIKTEAKYPLRLVYCRGCACAQLDFTVPKEEMFLDHTYVSGTNRPLIDHFAATAFEVDSLFFDGRREKSVLDIGSNDGSQLLQFVPLGYETVGVEACARVAELAQKRGIHTVVDFFNAGSAARLERKFDVINAAGVFFHLEELHSAAEGVRQCLAEEGVFVIQFLYMKRIMEHLAFDQIYHEHLLYYTLETLGRLLGRHGLEAFDGYPAAIHGGSIVLFAGHAGRRPKTHRLEKLLAAEREAGANDLAAYQRFAERVESVRTEAVAFLDRRKREGKRIYGFGAPVKGNTLLNYCGIGKHYLDCLVEKNKLRRGLYSPGMHIPIRLEGELDRPPDVYFVLAWNYKQEILLSCRKLTEHGVEFYFPVDPDGKPKP